LLEEENQGEKITISRYLGQQICDGSGRMRIDFSLSMSEGGGQSRTTEHFIQLSGSDRYKFTSVLGSVPVKSRGDDLSPSMSFVNPFEFSLGGSIQLRSRNSSIENVAKGYQIVEGVDNSIRNIGDDAVFFKTFSFEKDGDWKFNRYIVFSPAKGCGKSGKKWSQFKNVDEDVKKWHKCLTVNVNWKEMDRIGFVPNYVHSIRDGHICNDLSARDEFEAFFWGEEFDVDVSRYFKKDRLTAENLVKDFPLGEIERQSSQNRSNVKKR
jgi:hypothetical protein